MMADMSGLDAAPAQGRIVTLTQRQAAFVKALSKAKQQKRAMERRTHSSAAAGF
jgi:hypothetical protein